jgi:hypothetical protein
MSTMMLESTRWSHAVTLPSHPQDAPTKAAARQNSPSMPAALLECARGGAEAGQRQSSPWWHLHPK